MAQREHKANECEFVCLNTLNNTISMGDENGNKTISTTTAVMTLLNQKKKMLVDTNEIRARQFLYIFWEK